MSNDYIEFYGKNKISPVNQDISDLRLHYRRRQKLYRQCGIPTIAFKDNDILEVGPGGGHNALALLNWGIHGIEMVEPNITGVETIKKLFTQYHIDPNIYKIVNTTIEEYNTERHFDIVLAEGFLSYVPNPKEICHKLGRLAREGGVVVVTCSDDTSILIELIKRLIGICLTSDIDDFNEKVEKLIPIFEPQLESLRGVSRPAKDWIEDNIFNPVFSNGLSFSLGDALDAFKGFDLLGGSPKMFTDYSWYKDIWYDEFSEYKDQFDRKRNSLIMADMPEVILSKEDSNKIQAIITKLKKIENEYEHDNDRKHLDELYYELVNGRELFTILGDYVSDVYDDLLNIIRELEEGITPSFDNYPNLFKAFGRGLQYISFMKLSD